MALPVAWYPRRKALQWRLLARGWRPILAAARLHRATLSRRRHVVLVTGCYGKTTTTRALRAIFGLRADGWAELNTNCLGEVGWTVLREAPWRPIAVEAGIGTPGKMRVYARAVRPDTTIVTGVGREHLRAFGSMEAVREEKAEAVRALSADAVAILNADDAGARWMATQTAARVRWFGLDPSSPVSARDVALDWPHGTRLTLVVDGRAVPLRTRLIGRHFVYPLLAAVSAGLAAGIRLDAMLPALERLPPTPARLEPLRLANGAYLLCDDYKGTPDTFAPALAVLAALPARRRLVVLGDLNNLPSYPAAPHYAEVGAAVARVADEVLVVGGRLDAYGAGLRAAGFPSARLAHAADVAAATAMLRRDLRDGDVALLKGCEDQGLTRIALALAGRAVRCPVDWCAVRLQACGDCPLLDVPLPLGAGAAP